MPRHPESQNPLKATATPSPVDPERSWNLYLAPLIREHLYAPDGKPPEGWSIGRDLRICKLMLSRSREDVTQIEAAIRGLRVIYPTGKLTLRLWIHRKDGTSELYRRCVAAAYQKQKRGPSAIGAVMQQAGLRATGIFRRSVIPKSHGNLNQVWVADYPEAA